MLADCALTKVIELQPKGSTLLDVGSGAGHHADKFRAAGLVVTTLDFGTSKYALAGKGPDITGNFYEVSVSRHDCVWCSHVLEHQPNPNLFLCRCVEILPVGGLLAVTVPPRKDAVVGGHVTLWNAGVLIYQMVLAGLDCSDAMVRSYGYNVSVLVRKPPVSVSETIRSTRLDWDCGDIERLGAWFPPKCRTQGFGGVIQRLNWA